MKKEQSDHFSSKAYKRVLDHISQVLANRELMKKRSSNRGIEVLPKGQTLDITAEHTHIVDSLLSAFDSAFQKNIELEQANRELVEAKEKLAQQAKELEELSLRDELTGLYNRRGFISLTEHELRISKRTLKPLLLLFIDIDGMKSINDTLGHKIGDEAIMGTAAVLRRSFRDSDIIARIGGDEFTVLTIEADDENIEIITNRIMRNMEAYDRSRGKNDITFTLSIGDACFDPARPCSIEELMELADQSMYSHKTGKQIAVNRNVSKTLRNHLEELGQACLPEVKVSF